VRTAPDPPKRSWPTSAGCARAGEVPPVCGRR
jgi:hypothetical protein